MLLLPVFVSLHTFSQIPGCAAWLGVQAPVRLHPKWQWRHDAGYRTIGFSASASQYFYRTGIRYQPEKNFSIAAGPALFFIRSSDQKFNHEYGKEFRLWQELSQQSVILRHAHLQNRLRLEQRWFQQTGNNKTYFGFRFRYRLSYTFLFSKQWGLHVAEEYMRQISDRKFSFNQNRSSALFIFQINDATGLQAGYM